MNLWDIVLVIILAAILYVAVQEKEANSLNIYDAKQYLNFLGENKSVKLCKDNVSEHMDTHLIQIPTEADYQILQIKEFNSFTEAELFRKKHTTVDMRTNINRIMPDGYVVAVVTQTRIPNGLVEPFTGITFTQITETYLCDENGKLI